ncbi:acyl--CoA ligase [Sphingopyxis granuli]|uniref:class I adenylate-forming enzyme family protein n=1 Tax=Sphingopyxis granuli TaxID=267128 RepID=UPI001F52EF67|nr:class I adenylate-forming enzyme family protein [Sphingopyxis granuli]UNK80652.1 acyl--CoA ligase [Sphingopyxis granuli]
MLTHRDVLSSNASAYGARVALVSDQGEQTTYLALEERTNRLARGMLDLGLRRGDRVIWLDQNSVEFLVAYFATAKIGVTFTPLNYWLRAGELAPQIELVSPRLCFAGEEFAELADEALSLAKCDPARILLQGQRDGWRAWSEAFSEIAEPIDTPIDEVDVHEIIFTSGTTGQAKGVMRSQRKRILDSYCAALAFELTRSDHMLWFLPQFHIGGGSVPNQLLVQGGKVTVLRRFDPAVVASHIDKGITYIVGVPAHYNLLFESGVLDGVDTSKVRGCYVGGSASGRVLFEQILARFPNAELVHGYGSTESGPHTMALRGQDFLDHFGALGLPVPGSRVRVLDPETLTDAAPGIVGELLVKSEAVMDGYLGRPDLTEVAFHEGWLRTGDLVVRDADGWFSMVDRLKDMVITGGENVYPKEVEDVLTSHSAVAEAAVFGVPDPTYEERVIACVRLVPDAQLAGTDALISYVRERLAGYKTPKEIMIVEDFPRTGVGKISKVELRDQYMAKRRAA